MQYVLQAILYKLIETLIASVVLIPCFLVLSKSRLYSKIEAIMFFAFALYLSAVYLFVGMPAVTFIHYDLSLTLVPFLPMLADIKNTIYNIILFLPLGIMLPFLWKRYDHPMDTLVFGFLMSLSIEVLQILTFRATDINDIIANTFGVALGYFAFRGISHVIPPIRKFARKKNEVFVIILIVFITMFFVQPYLARLYYTIF